MIHKSLRKEKNCVFIFILRLLIYSYNGMKVSCGVTTRDMNLFTYRILRAYCIAKAEFA